MVRNWTEIIATLLWMCSNSHWKPIISSNTAKSFLLSNSNHGNGCDVMRREQPLVEWGIESASARSQAEFKYCIELSIWQLVELRNIVYLLQRNSKYTDIGNWNSTSQWLTNHSIKKYSVCYIFNTNTFNIASSLYTSLNCGSDQSTLTRPVPLN